MYPAIIIGTVRSLIVDVAMGQIPRSTERISSFSLNSIALPANCVTVVEGRPMSVKYCLPVPVFHFWP